MLYIQVNRVAYENKLATKVNDRFLFEKELALDHFMLRNRDKSKELKNKWAESFSNY